MKKIFLVFSFLFLIFSCSRKPVVYMPIGAEKQQEDDEEMLKIRTKNLNIFENRLIKKWINSQDEIFFQTSKNYWINIKKFSERKPNPYGQMISYMYYVYDFEQNKIYEQPIEKQNVATGKIDDIQAVADALKYLNKNENATLLVPSSSAFGIYGDGKKIPGDFPLIIKIFVE